MFHTWWVVTGYIKKQKQKKNMAREAKQTTFFLFLFSKDNLSMAPLLAQNVWNKVKQGLYLFYADICCFVVIRKYITFHKFNKLSWRLMNLIEFYMFTCIYFSMTLCSLEKLFSIHNSCRVVHIKTINTLVLFKCHMSLWIDYHTILLVLTNALTAHSHMILKEWL